MNQTAARIAALSDWIDAGNSHRDTEAQLWGRVSKVTEEAGESIAALIGATGQNPRKGVTHSMVDVCEELLDVAITALGAIEHIMGNNASSIDLLESKVAEVCKRAGVSTTAPDPGATPPPGCRTTDGATMSEVEVKITAVEWAEELAVAWEKGWNARACGEFWETNPYRPTTAERR